MYTHTELHWSSPCLLIYSILHFTLLSSHHLSPFQLPPQSHPLSLSFSPPHLSLPYPLLSPLSCPVFPLAGWACVDSLCGVAMNNDKWAMGSDSHILSCVRADGSTPEYTLMHLHTDTHFIGCCTWLVSYTIACSYDHAEHMHTCMHIKPIGNEGSLLSHRQKIGVLHIHMAAKHAHESNFRYTKYVGRFERTFFSSPLSDVQSKCLEVLSLFQVQNGTLQDCNVHQLN